eukprot:CAMPEP_0175053302 /NCGR_PEP_ID=MMETSP0052_2-20121109/8846_1 /TAXON_ID=51329 ORGANISM="Polytomella parva, Strain SAG 63-3" /NCGR_SAMPLE_ID=MMETSP0052_2 /ASSEMBLY_ACC=CAM_ASM_000194 /LENGTH=234 /DNA_ID=CAMNT_0016317815 /DNA_START=352 /DNA_END=1056 /DNA_ORIENTATION=+
MDIKKKSQNKSGSLINFEDLDPESMRVSSSKGEDLDSSNVGQMEESDFDCHARRGVVREENEIASQRRRVREGNEMDLIRDGELREEVNGSSHSASQNLSQHQHHHDHQGHHHQHDDQHHQIQHQFQHQYQYQHQYQFQHQYQYQPQPQPQPQHQQYQHQQRGNQINSFFLSQLDERDKLQTAHQLAYVAGRSARIWDPQMINNLSEDTTNSHQEALGIDLNRNAFDEGQSLHP